jgi:hypothetical protein
LSREDIVSAAAMSDKKATEWFVSRSRAERLEQWNQVAVNLGRPGCSMAEPFPVALATTYKHVAVFQVLEADGQEG